jgi:hypothetical protein
MKYIEKYFDLLMKINMCISVKKKKKSHVKENHINPSIIRVFSQENFQLCMVDFYTELYCFHCTSKFRIKKNLPKIPFTATLYRPSTESLYFFK